MPKLDSTENAPDYRTETLPDQESSLETEPAITEVHRDQHNLTNNKHFLFTHLPFLWGSVVSVFVCGWPFYMPILHSFIEGNRITI